MKQEDLKRLQDIVDFCENNKECHDNEFCPDCYIEIEDVKAIKNVLEYIKNIIGGITNDSSWNRP